MRNQKSKNLIWWTGLSKQSCIDLQQSDFFKGMTRKLAMMIQYLKRLIIWKKVRLDFLEQEKRSLSGTLEYYKCLVFNQTIYFKQKSNKLKILQQEVF